jgi:hypothetical protein
MFPDLYRQTSMFRQEAIRRAEQHRLVRIARIARRLVRPTLSQIEVK